MNGSGEAFIFSSSWMLVLRCTLSHPQNDKLGIMGCGNWDWCAPVGIILKDKKGINAIQTMVVLDRLDTYLV